MSQRAPIVYLVCMFGALAIGAITDSCAKQECYRHNSPEQCK